MGILSVDTAIHDLEGKLIVSYGPRKLVDDGATVIPAESEDDIEFYGVYRHHPTTGDAECVFDVCTLEDAEIASQLLAKYESIRKIVAE